MSDALPLTVEPGPGVSSKPFVLRVLDDAGVQVTEAEIKSRRSVTIPLNGSGSLTLHAEGGGKKVGSDDRIMNFRVFQYSPDLIAAP